MCDYSLYAFRTRLASEGEQLVLHRFETGSIGFTSACELQQEMAKSQKKRGFLRNLIDSLRLGPQSPLPAVCIPPGASLGVSNVPAIAQVALGIPSCAEVVFDELSTETYSYRDLLRFPNGREVLLQDLPEGMRAVVLSLGPARDAAREQDFRRPVLEPYR
ncbi:MAG: hypothetical protein JOY54_11835 [Acidobacteriaceae bacterium]|nr:hypothetical protein [Acidobacteriaceae bacterium]